jgi:hypothetical protein
VPQHAAGETHDVLPGNDRGGGIVGIADSRLTSGSEIISAKKVTLHQQGEGSLFIMTSGLRSVRDKTMTYFEEAVAERDEPFDRLFKAVNTFADQIRVVTREDKAALTDSGLKFDFYALVGGQLVAGSRASVVPRLSAGELGRGREGNAISNHRLTSLRQARPRPDFEIPGQPALCLESRLSWPSIPLASAPRTWTTPLTS